MGGVATGKRALVPATVLNARKCTVCEPVSSSSTVISSSVLPRRVRELMEPLQSSSIASIISHASHLLQFGQIGAFELLQMAPEIV